MSASEVLARKLTTRNIIALATVAVFLYGGIFALENANELVTQVENEDPKTAFVLGGAGGALLTALVLVSKEVYFFYFRKKPASEPST